MIRNFLLLISLFMLLVASPFVEGQISNDAQPSEAVQTPGSGAVPAMGQEPVPVDAGQFPPLSGLDEPSLEPNVAARSFLSFGGQASELVDSNASNNFSHNSSPLIGVTHLLGSVALQRLWERYQVALAYVGGGGLYAGTARPNSQMHELNFNARTLWRRGALSIRDSASYLPDGSFSGSFENVATMGGLGSLGGALGGTSGERFNFFGANSLGSLGAVPRVTNLALVDMQQSLSPRSAFTLAGGYNLMHFTQSTGGLFVDSHESTAQAGYDYSINARDKLALIYGYQHFQFPSASGFSFATHVAQFLYGHTITGRLDLLLGAGPQLTELNSATEGSTLKLSASGRVSLRYRFPRTSLRISYNRYNSVASGFFAGATTDQATFSISRPISRRWLASAHLGYSHNKRLQTVSVGVNANSYQAGFAGLRVARNFSRSLEGFVFYDFNDLALDRSFCAGSEACNRTSIRHAVGIGLMWHPHAIRLD